MKKQRTKIYIISNSDDNSVIYSGIDFKEFNNFLLNPIENLMNITGGHNIISIDTEFDRGLELFEGYEQLNELYSDDVNGLDNFCFIDYSQSHATFLLSEEQIAELLYLGHMFKPLKEPFFEKLQNRFVYLSHDDGYFCKLYYRNINEFIEVVVKKIINFVYDKYALITKNIDDSIKDILLSIMEKGIFLDFNDVLVTDTIIKIPIYLVGKIEYIDDLFNFENKYKTKEHLYGYLLNESGKWQLNTIR